VVRLLYHVDDVVVALSDASHVGEVVFRPSPPPDTAGPSVAAQTLNDAGSFAATPTTEEVGQPYATSMIDPICPWDIPPLAPPAVLQSSALQYISLGDA
ncbi:UNVERIFIED_CONTAM: hypothetical protein Sindi_2290300, partial [Sesamum indicum]